ncbi:hypothetical protein O181_001443 [Austropuccinia psidii MF-1]|uniref:Uncharacterized protein n=1 Tax=Austropuccinia psidii MF-1 TaxID=1389203 RepID=A0A9Q3BAS7_9BASI|nr:hypothetical protein [Austropuccinia psidii MF-1]
MRYLSTQEKMFIRPSPHDTSIEPLHPSCGDVPPQSTPSHPLHAPTPGHNNLNQDADCQTQNPPVLVKTEQASISQRNSTPNVEFCPNFIIRSKCLIQDNQLKSNIKQHLKQSTLWLNDIFNLWVVKNLHKAILTSTNAHLHIPNGLMN